jgi:23S rRNA pseudouridine955/2504/2580 synthase
MTKTLVKSKARLQKVPADEAGRRLDNYLMAILKGLPKPRIYRMIRSGEVRVNGGRARPDRRLQAGDELRIPPHHPSESGAMAAPPADKIGWLNERVIYEDEDFLALNKPSGLAVHGGSGVSWGAIELLRAARPQARFLELVHRLDRETSGCLLIAKRRPALRQMHEQFRDGLVRKQYQALLCGRMRGTERFVDAPLLTTQRRGGERHVQVDETGKPARSRITPRRRFHSLTLVDVVIETGRTHQIRVHAESIGHPVAGDQRYGVAAERAARRFGLQRLFLHAERLSFDSPESGQVIRVECPLDEDLQAVLERIAAAERT